MIFDNKENVIEFVEVVLGEKQKNVVIKPKFESFNYIANVTGTDRIDFLHRANIYYFGLITKLALSSVVAFNAQYRCDIGGNSNWEYLHKMLDADGSFHCYGAFNAYREVMMLGGQHIDSKFLGWTVTLLERDEWKTAPFEG
jgi:hypothetical protein